MLCCATNRYLSSFKLASDKCDAFEWPADSWAGQGGQPCGDIQTNSANHAVPGHKLERDKIPLRGVPFQPISEGAVQSLPTYTYREA